MTQTTLDLDLLRRLSEAIAVSGDEGEVRKLVLEAIEGHAGEIRVDALGNVLARKNGRVNGRGDPPGRPYDDPPGRPYDDPPGRPHSGLRVMVAAHMDEVGFMVMGVAGDGTLIIEPVGGVDERQLLGKPVRVGANRVPGVIGAKPVHLMDAAERERPIKFDALRVDIGAGSADEAKALVKIGDRGAWEAGFAGLGPTLRGKALDDRLGCAALIELLRGDPLPVDLCAAFTVQEEVGLRGARVAAFAFDPQAAIALDVTPANDLPAHDGEEHASYNTRLGAGPAIYVADRGALHHPGLVRHLIQTAERHGIPYQIRQPGGGSTDAAAMHLTRAGIPAVALSTPGRYLHTALAHVNVEDWRNTLRLARAALEDLTPETLQRGSR